MRENAMKFVLVFAAAFAVSAAQGSEPPPGNSLPACNNMILMPYGNGTYYLAHKDAPYLVQAGPVTAAQAAEAARDAIANGCASDMANEPCYNRDSDGDSWSDCSEIEYGTDPNDGGNCPDCDERDKNPPCRNTDSDGDGYDDCQEAIWGSDPTDPYDRPPGANCPPGQFCPCVGRNPTTGQFEECPTPSNPPWYPYPPEPEPDPDPDDGGDNPGGGGNTPPGDDTGGDDDGGGDSGGDGGGDPGGGGNPGGGGTPGGGDGGGGSGGSGGGGSGGGGSDGGGGSGDGDGGDGGGAIDPGPGGSGDGDSGNDLINLDGIIALLQNILGESRSIDNAVKNLEHPDVDLSGVLKNTRDMVDALAKVSEKQKGEAILDQLFLMSEEDRARAFANVTEQQKALEAMNTIAGTVADGTVASKEGFQKIQASLDEWFHAWYQANENNPAVLGMEAVLQFLTSRSEKEDAHNRKIEEHNEKVEHAFTLLSESDFTAVFGEEELARMDAMNQRIVDSVNKVHEAAAANNALLGESNDLAKNISDAINGSSGDIVRAIERSEFELEASFEKVGDDLTSTIGGAAVAGNLETIKTESIKIASELASLVPVVEDVKKLVEVVEEKTESDKSFQERLEELVQKADPEVVSLLGEIRDRPVPDLSKIEELLAGGNATLEEILEAVRNGEATDLSGIEGKLDGIKDALENLGGGEEEGETWEGLGGWGKPDPTDEMASKIKPEDFDEMSDRITDAVKGIGLDPSGLSSYSPRSYTTSFRLPVSVQGSNTRWETYSFSLDDLNVSGLPSDVRSSVQTLRKALNTVLKALASLIFLVRTWRLIMG